MLNCSSKYAKRLYALACQWRSIGKKRFEISELKKILGLINKKGKNNSQVFRMWDKNKSLSLLNLKRFRLYLIEPFNALRSEKKVPLSPTGFSWEVKLQKLWERLHI